MPTPVRYHPTAEALRDDASKVKPHPDNPRNGDTDAIIASIRENGCYRPVFAWAQTGEILAGNHTYAALLEMGETRIPIAWIDAPTKEAAAKILLADNRTADMGRYDEAQLLDVLNDLDGDLDGTGYTPDDVANIQALLDSDGWGDGDRHHDGGNAEDDAFNPRIDLRVTTRIFEGWRAMLDSVDGSDDVAKLGAYLDQHGFLTD